MFIIIFHFESIANVAGQTNLKKLKQSITEKNRDPVRISNSGRLIIVIDSVLFSEKNFGRNSKCDRDWINVQRENKCPKKKEK